jgi:putative membrane protein
MRTSRWFLAALAVGVLTLASSAAAATAGGMGSSTASGKMDKKLLEGVEKLHAANQAEIQSGHMAEQAASSSDVKAFGQRMVTDHGQNDQQLTGMAQTLGVNLKGKAYTSKLKDAESSMKGLHGKTGTAFDRAYIDAMVKDHEKDSKDVKKLADQARKDGQADLAAFLDQTEQTMQGHLSQAKQLQAAEKSAAKGSSSMTGTGSSSK